MNRKVAKYQIALLAGFFALYIPNVIWHIIPAMELLAVCSMFFLTEIATHLFELTLLKKAK